MKIIKHCYEERANIDTPRGGLLGLVIDNRLELTNTFPFPFTKAGEESVDEGTPCTSLYIYEFELNP